MIEMLATLSQSSDPKKLTFFVKDEGLKCRSIDGLTEVIMISTDVLMVSPGVLNTPNVLIMSTHDILLMYSRYLLMYS